MKTPENLYFCTVCNEYQENGNDLEEHLIVIHKVIPIIAKIEHKEQREKVHGHNRLTSNK